jgi:hypothetical protein
MTLLSSQKRMLGFGIFIKRFGRPVLKQLSQRPKALRLRQKDPQWAGVALLVVVADILLAMVTWIAVDFFLR